MDFAEFIPCKYTSAVSDILKPTLGVRFLDRRLSPVSLVEPSFALIILSYYRMAFNGPVMPPDRSGDPMTSEFPLQVFVARESSGGTWE